MDSLPQISEASTLAQEVVRRKLPEVKLQPGKYKLAGTALVDLQVGVDKSENTFAKRSTPWRAIVALLVPELGRNAATAISAAARKAFDAERETPLPHEIELALDLIRETYPLEYRDGPTRIAGDVALVGFAPSEIVLPNWREVKEAIAARRAA